MGSGIAVLAVGGNSLIKDKEHVAMSWQYEAVKESARYIADLIEEGLSIVITHGNGPQVGEKTCVGLPSSTAVRMAYPKSGGSPALNTTTRSARFTSRSLHA